MLAGSVLRDTEAWLPSCAGPVRSAEGPGVVRDLLPHFWLRARRGGAHKRGKRGRLVRSHMRGAGERRVVPCVCSLLLFCGYDGDAVHIRITREHVDRVV